MAFAAILWRRSRSTGPTISAPAKVAVGILLGEDEEPAQMRRWTSDDRDVRNDSAVAGAILEFIGEFHVRTVVMTDRIVGCPHEEGIDYQGHTCPTCPFWAGRDRWTGEAIP